MNGHNQRRGGAYSSAVSRPSNESPLGRRGGFTLILVLLLPPVGLLLLWSQGVFRTRGRVLLTALATLEMMALMVLVMPKAELTTQQPVPAPPSAVTAAPAGQNLNALYNIEQLLYEQQASQGTQLMDAESVISADDEAAAQARAENEAALNTIVYSVNSGARFYHAQRVCGQTNNRELTVREAMSEGLGACPNCNPPVATP